jgi:hypothetical protein
MKYKLKSGILALVMCCLAASCQSEYDIIDNGVYLTDAQSSSIKRVTIDNTGAKTAITSRLGALSEQDVVVNYGFDPQALIAYNRKNGTDYQLLPESYYSFSENQAIIKAGTISSEPVELQIKPFDESIDVTKKYAVPVAIVSSSGMERLETSSTLMVLLDQIVVTTVPYLGSGNYISVTPEQPLEGLSSWTLEWNLYMDSYTRNNVTQWKIYGIDDKVTVYTRFGDVTCDPNQFQAKVGAGKPQSITRFTAKKWYHLAFTYDGSNLRLYVDGKLDFTYPHAAPGEVFAFKKIVFANDEKSTYSLNGMVSELRVWSVARSQTEVENNMYVVSPDSPGLEVYWKCNEGGGTMIKDYSNHSRDGKLAKEATWEDGIRFPDDGK